MNIETKMASKFQSWDHKLLFLAVIALIPVSSESTNLVVSDWIEQSKNNEMARNLQFGQDCYLDFLGCDPQPSAGVDLSCNYEIEPGTGDYESILYPCDENGGCSLEEIAVCSDIVSFVDADTVGPESCGDKKSGKGENGEFDLDFDFNKPNFAQALKDDPNLSGISFCVRSDIIVEDINGNKVKLAPHLTKIDCQMQFDGEFETTILISSEVIVDEYSIESQYTVDSYICDENSPHGAISPTTEFFPGDILSVCVITNEPDTIIQNILDYELCQYNEAGEIVHSFVHVGNGVISTISGYDCTQIKPGSTTSGSMCVIQAKLTSPFFQNPDLGIVAKGNSDLRLNPEFETGRRKLQFDGINKNKRTVATINGNMEVPVKLFSDDAMITGSSVSLRGQSNLLSFCVLVITAWFVF